MMAFDEDALYCDFAETYHIIDFYELPIDTAARLAAGLRSDSRIKSGMAGLTEPMGAFMLADVADSLHLLLWAQTKDGQKGRNRPKQISQSMVRKKEELLGVGTFDEFDKLRKRLFRR